MSIDDYVEAFARGEHPEVPPELQAEVSRAVAGLGALRLAIGDTTVRAEEPADDRKAPELPEDYQIVRELGRGGMGVVYLAKQRSLDRLVAVKVLRPGELAFGPIVRRFVDEARHLAKLRHPNIVAIHETGQAGSEPYFTMDYVQGETLSQEIRRGPLFPSRAVGLLAQACEGVAHAHRQGIVHRDLKPGNILVDANGRAYVTDFGLARDLSRDSSLTGSGDIVGTPAYMSPEQANGETAKIGERTDVYALGVILYEALTGQSPYGHGSPVQVLARLLRDEPTPPRKANPKVPRDLETICLKAMEKDPERRYATVKALLEDLRRFEKGEPLMARRTGVAGRAWRFLGRHKKLIAAASFLTLLVCALGPILFDKSADAILKSADDEHSAGNHLAAVSLYKKAERQVPSWRREEIARRAVRCASELGDSADGVRAWDLLSHNDNWHPQLGLLIAKTIRRLLVVPVPKWKSDHEIDGLYDPNNRLVSIDVCLSNYLHGGFGTAEEQAEASALLKEVQRLEQKHSAGMDATIVPSGPIEELERKADDASTNDWERGKAAYAAGLALKRAGDRAGALAQLRKGLELMRRAYPSYSRTIYDSLLESKTPFQNPHSPPECGLVANASKAIRELDPQAPNPCCGGIRLKLEGSEQGPPIPYYFMVWLEATEGANAPKGEEARPESRACLDANHTTWIGIADGKYSLNVVAYPDMGTSDEDEEALRFMEWDFSALPGEVEIHGETVDLPPVRMLWYKPIHLLEPQAAHAMDLQHDVFRWTPVPGASFYRVEIEVLTAREPYKSYDVVFSEDVTSNEICLGRAPAARTGSLRERLTGGKSAEISVGAYDASGKKIGTFGRKGGVGAFVVSQGLDGK